MAESKSIEIPNYLINSSDTPSLFNVCGVVCVQCTIQCTICMGCVSCMSGEGCDSCQNNCTSSCTSSCTSGCTSTCTYCTSNTTPFPTESFEWDIQKVKGNEFRFTPSEYSRYADILNKKLIYFSKQILEKSTVQDGEIVYANTINIILAGLRRCNAVGVPNNVSPTEKITAEFLNKLRECLNSIKQN